MDKSTLKSPIRPYSTRRYVYLLICLILLMAIVTISFFRWQSNEFKKTELRANNYHLYTMHNCVRIKEEAQHILVYIYETLVQDKLKKKSIGKGELNLNNSFSLIKERLEEIKERQQHYKHQEYKNVLKNAENITNMILSKKDDVDYTSIADMNEMRELLYTLHTRFEQLQRLHRIAYNEDRSNLLSKELQGPRDIFVFLFSLGTFGFIIIAMILKTIRATEEELYKHRQHLQKLVEERTAKLNRTNETLRNEVIERKRAEEELIKQQYFLSKAQEMGKMGTWELDIKENKLIWTEENYHIFGLPTGTPLTYEKFLGCVHPDDREYVDKEWKAAFNKKPYDIEHRLLMKDGSIKWVREKAELKFDEQGNCLRGTGFTQDITERKYAEEEVKESEEKYRMLIKTSNDAVFLAEAETGTIIETNKKAELLLGRPQEEIIGMHYSQLHPPNEIVYCGKDFLNLIEEGGNVLLCAHAIHKDGHKIPVEISGNIIYVKDKRIIQGIFRDISERKKAEEVIKARQKEIEEINANLEKRVQEEVEKSRQKDYIMIRQSRLAAMGEMIRFITHQWGQPLWALQLLFHNIEDLIEDSGINQEDINELIANGFALIKRIIDTMNDFKSFFQTDKEKVTFSINKNVKETLSLLGANFKYSNVSIILNEKEELMVSGFPNEFSQVILNILNNSKDAIVEKGIKGEIKMDFLCKDDSAIVRIRDNGGGIQEEILDKIFDSYFTTKKEGKGTGIGLYLSKMIIEDRMKGRINVKNTTKGVEFEINLPIIRS